MSMHHNDHELLDEQTFGGAQSENRNKINSEEGQSLLMLVEKEEELNTEIAAENSSSVINNADRKSYGAIPVPVGMDHGHGKNVNEVNMDGNSSASKDTNTNKARINHMTADESWTLDETTIFSDNSNEFSATTTTTVTTTLQSNLWQQNWSSLQLLDKHFISVQLSEHSFTDIASL
mmetsp:Transcript_7641/g.11338  ORF Transcript_7641/g.11338 Transcript_7641/m.11338 type:complete len:177 (+) Transcript_7641:106-636(+)